MSVLGIIDIYWLGNKLNNENGGTVKLGGVVNKPVIFSRQVAPAQMMTESEITCTVPIQQGDIITELYGLGAGELQVKCDSGQTFVWENAFLTDPRQFSGDGKGGSLKLKWSAGAPVEV